MGVADASLEEIVPGAYAWVQPEGGWWVNNAGLVSAQDGSPSMVVDTCVSSARTLRFLEAAAEATGGAPVRLAVNTHQHGDHTYGNHLLPGETVIAAQEKARDGIVEDPFFDGVPEVWEPMPDWSDAVRRPPELTFREELTLHVGGVRAEVRHPGYTAHTPGDAVVWLPEQRVLYAGDLVFNQVTPLIFMGSLEGARRAVEWLDGFDADHLVPGHGALLEGTGIAEALAEQERYYAFVARTAERGREDGAGPLEAARGVDLGEFASWPDAERIVLNLHRAYAEAEGRRMDMIAAFTDTLAFTGGPLPCDA
ncbi:MBL fold metallo-hydrolase [Nocardiopsis chromatogenes]|uniref:MBL fold metallo-hydrolase n=1 Tax=Nocardiopsis chromatogenes TaxID=280239 RepID=UPI0003462E9E|nr:MBL fold metallo-hydrolase [Nocardiopsis chromatogenes]